MTDQNTIEITLPMYARPRYEAEQQAIHDLVSEAERCHGVEVVLSPQIEYRSAEFADMIRPLEVLVGSNSWWIARPIVEEVIRQIVARFRTGPAAGQRINQPVIYINGNNNQVHITNYYLNDGSADDQRDASP